MLLNASKVEPMRTSREIITRLEADGRLLVRTKGSHCQFKHPAKPHLITVPHPKKELPQGLVRAIEKQAGWR